MKPNRMKEKIARGEPALGCSVMFPSPQVVEMLGFAGFDWVLIDCEHGSIGLGDVELMAMACDAVGITPIARPRTQRRERYPERDGPRRDGRAGAARQHGRGRAPRGGRGEVRPRRGARAGRRDAARQLGARRAHARLRRGRQRAVARVRPARARGGDPQHRCDPRGRGHRRVLHRPVGPVAVDGLSRQSQGAAGRQGDREALAKIVAAGRTPGMPATAETWPRSSARAAAISTRTCRACIGTGAGAFLNAKR